MGSTEKGKQVHLSDGWLRQAVTWVATGVVSVQGSSRAIWETSEEAGAEGVASGTGARVCSGCSCRATRPPPGEEASPSLEGRPGGKGVARAGTARSLAPARAGVKLSLCLTPTQGRLWLLKTAWGYVSRGGEPNMALFGGQPGGSRPREWWLVPWGGLLGAGPGFSAPRFFSWARLQEGES